MRIIAGEFRGRALKTLRGRAVRPTSDKLRETLFDILQADAPDSVFIDCYAGSGAVGLEAVSRGAREVFLIEQDAAAVRVIEQNIRALDVGARSHVLPATVKAGLRKLEAEGVRANICFLDPPYVALAEALRNIVWLTSSTLMNPEGLIVLEHARKDASPESAGPWQRTRLLQQGSSALSFYRPHSLS